MSMTNQHLPQVSVGSVVNVKVCGRFVFVELIDDDDAGVR